MGFFDSLSFVFRGYDLPRATSPSGLRSTECCRPDGLPVGKVAPGGAARAHPRGSKGPERWRPPCRTAGLFCCTHLPQHRAALLFLTYFDYSFLRCHPGRSLPGPTLGPCCWCMAVGAPRASPAAAEIPGMAHTTQVSHVGWTLPLTPQPNTEGKGDKDLAQWLPASACPGAGYHCTKPQWHQAFLSETPCSRSTGIGTGFCLVKVVSSS